MNTEQWYVSHNDVTVMTFNRIYIANAARKQATTVKYFISRAHVGVV